MKLKAIVVTDKDWGIGKDGGLLVHLPGDLKYFKEKTLDNIVIMGRATLDSLPGKKPLPGRTTIVLTNNQDLKGDFYTVNSLDQLSDLLEDLIEKNPDMIPFVCGGTSVYEQLMPYTTGCLVTRMDRSFDAEKFFPNLDEMDDFKLASEGPVHSENNVNYKFTEYERILK